MAAVFQVRLLILILVLPSQVLCPLLLQLLRWQLHPKSGLHDRLLSINCQQSWLRRLAVGLGQQDILLPAGLWRRQSLQRPMLLMLSKVCSSCLWRCLLLTCRLKQHPVPLGCPPLTLSRLRRPWLQLPRLRRSTACDVQDCHAHQPWCVVVHVCCPGTT